MRFSITRDSDGCRRYEDGRTTINVYPPLRKGGEGFWSLWSGVYNVILTKQQATELLVTFHDMRNRERDFQTRLKDNKMRRAVLEYLAMPIPAKPRGLRLDDFDTEIQSDELDSESWEAGSDNYEFWDLVEIDPNSEFSLIS